MHVIRDKVYDKLSSFFSDSQTSNEVVDQEPEVPFIGFFLNIVLNV